MAIAADNRKDGGNRDRARRDYRPHGTDDRPSLFATLKRTATEFSEDNLTDWAAALTYYGLLALFPALIALVSIVGLVADPKSTTQTVTDIVTQIGPESAAQTFSGPIESITSNRGAAGILFVVGLAVALWSASGYVGAFMRASNVIFETPEGRPFWKLRPLQMLVTLVMVILLASSRSHSSSPARSSSGRGAARHRRTAVTVWNIAKWPVIVAVVLRDDRRPLLRLAKREAARVQLGDPGQRGRPRRLGGRLRGVRVLRRELRLLQQDLRHARRRRRRCSSGSGSPTSPCCSGMSSTPSANAATSSTRGSRGPRRRSSSSRATSRRSSGRPQREKETDACNR